MPGPTPLGAANRNLQYPDRHLLRVAPLGFSEQRLSNNLVKIVARETQFWCFLYACQVAKTIDKCNPPRRYCFL
jgi:hypothetical protein